MSELRIADEFDGWEALAPQGAMVPERGSDAPAVRAVEHRSETVCMIGARGELNYVSADVRPLLGRDPWSFGGTSALGYVHPADRPRAIEWFRQLRDHDDAPMSEPIVLLLSGGERNWVTVEVNGRRVGGAAPHEVVCTLRLAQLRSPVHTADGSRRRASDAVVTRANFAQALQGLEPAAQSQPLVIFVDVDDFANVRLAFGEEAANCVVAQVRAVLSSLVRLDDVIGELEPGSLAVLFRDVPDDEVQKLVRRISRGLRHPVRTGAGRIRVSASIGSARPDPRPALRPELRLASGH